MASFLAERGVELVAITLVVIAAVIAGVAGVLYAYNFGSVSADRFGAVTALSLIAFAYAGGITLISGAVFAGLLSAQALIPYALDKWFGLNGNWFLLVGGLLLIFTLLQNPEGVAGDMEGVAGIVDWSQCIPPDAQAGRDPRAGDRRRGSRAQRTAYGACRPGQPPRRAAGNRPVRRVRRRARAARRHAGGPRG